MIRVVLAEDELPARERLKRMLAAFPEVEISGEASDGASARALIESVKPDAVFLDIEMPGADGLLVAASLPSPAPAVVFCTAYDRYAVDAFGVKAVDYLLKPVTRARLAETIERLRERLPLTSNEPARRFLGHKNGRIHVIPTADVICFASDGGLTRMRTKTEWLTIDPALNELERKAPGFFRVSRAALVNLEAVREILPMTGGTGEVILSNGDRIPVSRRRLAELMERVKR